MKLKVALRFSRRVALFMLFPVFCWADGVSVQHITLQNIQLALLVKVLAFDAKRQFTRVKLLKAFHRHDRNLVSREWGVYANEKDEEGLALSDIIEGKEYFLKKPRRREAIAGKWVIERRYWDITHEIKDGDTLIAVNDHSGFEWVKVTPEKQKKYEMYFGVADANGVKPLDAAIAKASVADLQKWQADFDLEKSATGELVKRGEMTAAKIIPRLPENGMMAIARQILMNKSVKERVNFYDEGRRMIVDQKLSEDATAAFLNLYGQYSGEQLPEEKEIEMFARLDGSNAKFREPISNMYYRIEQKVRDGKLPGFARLGPQAIALRASLKKDEYFTSNMGLSIFFYYLKGSKHRDFMRDVAKKYVEIGPKHHKAEEFAEVFDQVTENPDLETALILSEANFDEADQSRLREQVEAVMRVRLKLEDHKRAAARKSFVDFADRWVPKLKHTLSDDVMNPYKELKAAK